MSMVIDDKPFAMKVEAMAGYGIPAADIATVLAIDEQELRSTYAAELEGGHIKANARVAESLFRKATGEGREAVTAAIFWAKTRMGWRERGEPASREPVEVVIRRFSVDWEPAEPKPQPMRVIDGTLE